MSIEPGQPTPGENGLAHKLGPFDATLIVMGGIIGAGIFKNPAVVARLVPTPFMALGAWIMGGALALIGAFISLGVTFICIRALGIDGLAATKTPASEVMREAMGPTGAKLIALGIAVSTAGFLSQGVLTAPRVYYAMARDGVFFKAVGRLDKRTKAPVVAIVLQSALAACIALWVDYSQILDYVVSIDVIFFGLTAASLFVFRSREKSAMADMGNSPIFRVPRHPITTATFVLVCWAISINSIWTSPKNAGGGVVILLIGFFVYWFWRRKAMPGRSDLSG